MEVSEVLAEALRLMEMDGWSQGAFRKGMGLDPTGAIWFVLELHGHQWVGEGRLALIKCLRALRSGTGIANIALWNDAPDRTFAQVREVFRRSICEAELGEMRERMAA